MKSAARTRILGLDLWRFYGCRCQWGFVSKTGFSWWLDLGVFAVARWNGA